MVLSLHLFLPRAKLTAEYMTEIDCSRRIGSGPTRLGFKLGCMNFAEAFGNTPNSRSNRARNNSNLQQRLDAKFCRSDEYGGCQLAGNCQPASTLFLAPENSQFICFSR